MATPEELDALESAALTNASGPQSVTVEGVGTTRQHSLKDQLDALDRLDERASRSRSTLPVRIAKIRPDGTA